MNLQLSIDRQVFRVIQKYRAQFHDEIDMNIGDYITATEVSVINGDDEGWVFGSNLASGSSGLFAFFYF